MEHVRFKANQTAALYVANTLDEGALSEFELHMMDCPECLDDVEAWRAIKTGTRVQGSRPAAPSRVAHIPPPHLRPRAARTAGPNWSPTQWRVAASLLAATLLGAAAGWFGHEAGSVSLDPMRTEFFNLPPVTRAADDCTPLRLGTDTRTVVLRVAGLDAGTRLVATDPELQPLAPSAFSTRVQPDGSQVLSLDARWLDRNRVFLVTQAPAGARAPAGCVERSSASQ